MKKLIAFTLALTFISASTFTAQTNTITTLASSIDISTHEHVCGA